MAPHRYEFRPRFISCISLPIFAFAILSLSACGGDEISGDERWETEEPDEDNQASDVDGSDEELTGEFPDPTSGPPDHIVGIKTVLISPEVMSAGDPLNVECHFIDILGEEIVLPEEETPSSEVIRFPDNAFRQQGLNLFAQRSGRAEVACRSIPLGLTDPEPLEVIIEPGPVHTTNIELDRSQMIAGENAQATCKAYDAWGNPIDDAALQIISDISASGVVIQQDTGSISATSNGIYTFSCHAEGVQNLFGQTLDVRPDLPSELLVNAVPVQNVYGIGQVITLAAIAQDRFGNEVPDAQITYTSGPQGDNFGAGRFRFWNNDYYTLTAQVISPTYADVELSESVEIVVNESGPSIDCTSPFDGEMIQHTPGANLTVQGSATDALGVSEVLINDTPATLNPDGTFSFTLQPRYGINFVDITARDTFGEESVRTCAFLASSHYSTPTGHLTDAVALRLSQDAIDDNSNNGNIQSLNDIILRVLNSDGLRQTLLDGLRANQPYDVDFCQYDLYILDVSYEGAPHVTSIDLIGGGLRLYARLNDLRIHLRLQDGGPWYTGVCLINYEPRANLEYVEMQLTSNVNLNNSTNLPNITLHEIEFVESGDVSLSGGNWLSSALYGALDSVFQGTLRGLIEDTFESAVSENFNTLFDDLISSLDIDSLGGAINVPRLDSDDSIALNFGFQFSHVNANSIRLLFGLAPRLTPASGAAHAIPSLGVPRPAGSLRDAPADDSAGVGVHIALLNQALHSLWRAGLFHANIGATLFGDDVPDGTAVSLQAALPPMAILEPGTSSATIHLGGLTLSLQYPGLFEDPVSLSLGATATTQITMDGDEINFTNIQLDEFHLSPDEISLNQGSRDILEDFLRALIQNVLDQSLNAALPALPIPTFAIPPSMSTYNLPVGGEFGVVSPSFSQTSRHLLLSGQFGIR